MIEVRYTEGGEIDLAGSAQELKSLQTMIEQFVEGTAEATKIAADSGADAGAYDTCMAQVHLRRDSAENRIEIEDQSLVVSGSDEFLSNFAANLPWDAEDPASGIPYHVHYDVISFGNLLAEDSLGIVLTKKRETD